MKASMGSFERNFRLRVIVAFGLVYLLWGSTYLAMRVAIEHLPPFVMSAVRFLISGPVMLAYCALSGRKISLNWSDAWRLMAIGVLMLSVGNMGVAWAEQYVPTGLAALIVAIVPIWVAIIEAVIFRIARLRPVGILGLALGAAGVVVLLWPSLFSGTPVGRAYLTGAGVLAIASFGWAFGSVLSHRWSLKADVLSACGWEMVFAGVANTLVAASGGYFQRAVWTARGVGAIAYLVIFGSLIGFTAFIWLLNHVPPPKVATYAYVNPVVAVYLGWLVMNEKIDGYMLIGTAVILGAVALVNSSKLKAEHTLLKMDAERDLTAAKVGAD